MNHDPIVEEIYHHAFAEVLFDKAHEVLCPACSRILESEALERYRAKMAQRRAEISDLEAKAAEEKQRESRRRELQKENGENSHE
jgi:uncharacterized Zn finger protein (UPF0148 family)